VAITLRPLAREKGLALEVLSSPQQAELLCDGRTVSQILINLAGNAIKFTDTGHVRLTLDQRVRDGRPVTTFAVIDTGRGILPEDQTRLFAAFERISSGDRRPVEGSGLGLHISQLLAGLIGHRAPDDLIHGSLPRS